MSTRRILLISLLGLLCLAPVSYCSITDDLDSPRWAAGEEAPPHLRVVWLEDPAHEMVVSWTSPEGEDHRVYYDTEPRGGDLEAYRSSTAATFGRGDESETQLPFRHALLRDLEPSTTYYFTVVSDGRASREFHVVTAPDDDRQFKLLFGGDSRSDSENRRRMNRLLSRLLEEDPSILALVHGGDFVANGERYSQWDAWLEDHQLTTTSEGRVLPLIPVRGNHEGDGTLYNEVFGFPGGEQRDYFRTRIGAHATLLTLDTNSSLGGEQKRWLESELEEAQARRWLLASYHEPAYPAVKSPGAAKHHWVPLFERHRVDLALESDGHVLKRTLPISDDRHDPDGVVYVGEGGLGVGQRTPKEDRWYLQEPGMARAADHVQALTFGPEELVYEAVLEDGTIADKQTFSPRR